MRIVVCCFDCQHLAKGPPAKGMGFCLIKLQRVNPTKPRACGTYVFSPALLKMNQPVSDHPC